MVYVFKTFTVVFTLVYYENARTRTNDARTNDAMT